MTQMLAFYLRLSMSDGDLGKDNKDESNSIENQRLLLKSYLDASEELDGEVCEYVDDGYSGTNFNRPSFIRMIEDAKRGKISTILVKDLSRLGRDYIGVGDYLEQIFPVLGIRFIAVNSHYDSNKLIGKTMGLDMAVSNLVNSLYSRDCSKKVKSGLHARWKNGYSTTGRLPYGFVKDKSARGGWAVDAEPAKVIRQIFEKANGGWSTRMIADSLNEQGILTPGKYRESKEMYGGNHKTPDSERLWDVGMIRTILVRYEYTGAFVQNYREKVSVGSNVTRAVPEDKRVIIEDAHDAIIAKEEYENAQIAIRQMNKPKFKINNEYPLRGLIRCGVCRLSMTYLELAYEPVYYCPHKKKVGRHSDCCGDYIPAVHIDEAVWRMLRQQLNQLHDFGIQMELRKGRETKKGSLDCKQMRSEIDKLKAERIRQYEAYAEGILSREQYLVKKSALTAAVESLQGKLERLNTMIEDEDRFTGELALMKQKAGESMGNDRLTRELAEAFIDTVYVYDSRHIEVVFKFEDLLQRAMKKYA